MGGPGPVRGQRAFAALRSSPNRARTPVLSVTRSTPSIAVGEPRVSFAIGSHVGNAVVRNRVRRRLRSSLQTLTLPASDFLISVHRSGAAATYGDLDLALRSAMQRLGAEFASSTVKEDLHEPEAPAEDVGDRSPTNVRAGVLGVTALGVTGSPDEGSMSPDV